MGWPDLPTTPPPFSARPSGQPKMPPRAPHGALWSALARYGTTSRERVPKMVVSGASNQAPARLSLQRELHFHFFQSADFGVYFGPLLDPQRGAQCSKMAPGGRLWLNLGGACGLIWDLVGARPPRLSVCYSEGSKCDSEGSKCYSDGVHFYQFWTPKWDLSAA